MKIGYAQNLTFGTTVVFGSHAAGALITGSKTVGALVDDIPIFGVVSLWGIFGIGLLVILGGITVLTAVGQLLVVAILGVTSGAVLTYLARNVPT